MVRFCSHIFPQFLGFHCSLIHSVSHFFAIFCVCEFVFHLILQFGIWFLWFACQNLLRWLIQSSLLLVWFGFWFWFLRLWLLLLVMMKAPLEASFLIPFASINYGFMFSCRWWTFWAGCYFFFFVRFEKLLRTFGISAEYCHCYWNRRSIMVLWCCLLIIEFKELEIRISIIEVFGFEPLICITSAFGIVAYCTFEAPFKWGLVQKNWIDIWNTNWSC